MAASLILLVLAIVLLILLVVGWKNVILRAISLGILGVVLVVLVWFGFSRM